MEGTVITKKGIRLLAKTIAGENALTITRTAVGTGKILKGYDPASMIGLVEYKMDAVIAKCAADGDYAEIVTQVSSDGIKTGFLISEVGVFAEDPDEGEILYAYVDLSEDPQYMYPEGGQAIKFVEITLEIVIAEGTKVTTYLNPSSLIGRKEFDEVTEKLKSSLGNTDISDIGDGTVTGALHALNTGLGGLKLVTMTQAEYETLSVHDDTTIYFLT